MEKRILDNPYQGINAHLHSLAQNPRHGHPTIWTSIHASHIGDIINALNANLPMNYVARPEQSLQIFLENDDGFNTKPHRPRPDVGVYRTSITDVHTEPEGDNAPVIVIPYEPAPDDEISQAGVVIYEVRDHEIAGKPVTRIELLSAANKYGGSGAAGYIQNRTEALNSGTSLIELDYLHQSTSLLPGIAPYPDDANSYPYYIAVTDRRPSNDGNIRVYIRDVNHALPQSIAIPLADEDSIIFDFEAVYQHTFRIGRWGIHIDYSELPRNFESYSEKDQAMIRRIMESATQLLED